MDTVVEVSKDVLNARWGGRDEDPVFSGWNQSLLMIAYCGTFETIYFAVLSFRHFNENNHISCRMFLNPWE